MPTPDPAVSGQNKGRDRILLAVAKTLSEQGTSAVELQSVVEQSDVPASDVWSAFPDPGDLLVALGELQSRKLCDTLRADAALDSPERVRDVLTAFGREIERAYSSVLIGFCRVAMTEGSRHRDVRRRIYDGGPGAVTAALTTFLERARAGGHIAVDDCALAAENLMGLLREPMYNELTLHQRPDGRRGDAYVDEVIRFFLTGCGDASGVAR